MKTFLKAVLFIATLAMGNAHALCVNQDGSLNDLSLRYRAPIDMLPMCSAQAEPMKVAMAPVATAASLGADESVSVPIPYVFGDDAE